MATDKKKKEVFEIETGEGEQKQKLKLAVNRPKQAELKEAQKIYNATFREAIDAGAIVKARIPTIMQEQKIWSPEKDEEVTKLEESIKEARRKIPVGGKVSELKNLAMQIKKDSVALRELNSLRNSLDQQTAESQAEAARFNRLVSLCTVYDDTGNLYYKSYEDFLAKNDDTIATEASTKLMYMYYGLNPEFEANLPENKFLRQWGLIDDKLRLINEDKKLVDEEGRLINEEGRFIDPEGNFVDKEGNRVDKDGNYVPLEVVPFLDDNGNPIEPPNLPSPAQAE